MQDETAQGGFAMPCFVERSGPVFRGVLHARIKPRQNIPLQEREHDRCDEQDDRAADAGRNLCVDHQVHPLGRAQNSEVARAAHVGHIQSRCSRSE